jgi:hypothetical protein
VPLAALAGSEHITVHVPSHQQLMNDDDLASRAARLSLFEALLDTATSTVDASTAGMSQISLHDKLPIELLPEILRHLRYRQGELARTCLVCKEWARVSKPVSAVHSKR